MQKPNHISSKAFSELRNHIMELMVRNGMIEDTDDNFEAIDKIVANCDAITIDWHDDEDKEIIPMDFSLN